MSDTNFTSQVTPIVSTWSQDVNDAVYRAIGGGGSAPATPADVLTNLGLSPPTGSALIGYTNGATGSVARTVESKLQESVSVLDFGADPTGVADSTAAFSLAAAAAIANVSMLGSAGTSIVYNPVCEVSVPAGIYNLVSLVNTHNKDVVWDLSSGVKIINDTNLPGTINYAGVKSGNYHYGIMDYACGSGIICNSDVFLGSEITGLSSPSQLATYPGADSCGLFIKNTVPPILATIASATYTSNTVTPTVPLNAVQVAALRVGMIIDTISTPKYRGLVTGWAANGTSISVSAWYLVGNTTPTTPTTGLGAVINPFTSVFGQNTVLNLSSTANVTGDFAALVGHEIDLNNSKSGNISTVGINVVNTGSFAVNKGYQCSGSFITPFSYLNGAGTSLFNVGSDGNIFTNSYIANSSNFGGIAPPLPSQGGVIGWNLSNGGDTSLVNVQSGGSTGGFNFYNHAGTTTSLIGSLNGVGLLSVAGISTTGNVTSATSTMTAPASATATGNLELGNAVATSATAGGATALPATPAGYLVAYIGGNVIKVPYYNN